MAEIEGAPRRRGPTLRDVARRAQVSVGTGVAEAAGERPALGSGRERQLLGTHIVIRTSVRTLPGGAQA